MLKPPWTAHVALFSLFALLKSSSVQNKSPMVIGSSTASSAEACSATMRSMTDPSLPAVWMVFCRSGQRTRLCGVWMACARRTRSACSSSRSNTFGLPWPVRCRQRRGISPGVSALLTLTLVLEATPLSQRRLLEGGAVGAAGCGGDGGGGGGDVGTVTIGGLGGVSGFGGCDDADPGSCSFAGETSMFTWRSASGVRFMLLFSPRTSDEAALATVAMRQGGLWLWAITGL